MIAEEARPFQSGPVPKHRKERSSIYPIIQIRRRNFFFATQKGLDERTQTVEDVELRVYGVERTINSTVDLPTTWQSYFMNDGYALIEMCDFNENFKRDQINYRMKSQVIELDILSQK